MSFVVYDLTFLVVFTLLVVAFLYRNRANLKREGIMYLYRTELGIRLMKYVSKKYARILRPMQYLIIACGYALMAGMIWFLAKFTYTYSTSAYFVQATKIPPLIPLVPYLPDLFKVSFLPPFYFTYWIVIIAVIAIGHEFAHGVFAKLNGIRIKSTGFGFLGPFLAFFVEPDEKQVTKAKKFPQLAFIAAGTFANVVMTILFALVLWAFFALSFAPAGVNFNDYAFSVVNVSTISSIGSTMIPSPMGNLSQITVGEETYLVPAGNVERAREAGIPQIMVYQDAPAINAGITGPIVAVDDMPVRNLVELRSEIQQRNPGETVEITTVSDGARVTTPVTLEDNNGMPYLGIVTSAPSRSGISGWFYNLLAKVKDPFIYYEPHYDADLAWFGYHLLWWLVLINFSVALVNMLPVGIFDGGRFFYLTVWGITGKERWARYAFKFTTWAVMLILVWLMVRWFIAS